LGDAPGHGEEPVRGDVELIGRLEKESAEIG